jgi:alkylated DNA nucleotide flippase Atl1
MTGMFVKILAGVVAEDLAQRRQPRWPVWRLVNDNGTLSTTWPLDALYRATKLREEGVKLGRRAGAWQVLPTEAG